MFNKKIYHSAYSTFYALILHSSVYNPNSPSILNDVDVNRSGKFYKGRLCKDEAKHRLLTSMQKTYAYSQGKVATIAYTTQNSAITTETSTYQNGYLKKMTLDGGQVVYDLQEENAMGRPTKVISGPVTRNYSFDPYGMPTGRSAQTQAAGTYMNFEYSFNATTGNLNYRKDITRNITENFSYDNLNRLTGFAGQTVNYDPKGNITQKSGIGNYHYLNNAKPYTLTGIVQSGNVMPERQQQITYASFSRPLTITEDGYSAQFTYEAGGDRVKMQVTQNGTPVLTRHYLANQYELDEKPGSSREKLYLGGDYYSAGAVLVRDNGGAWQVFYINSDYLGSVTHIVNSAGAVIVEYSYDAWGRLRNPATQVAYAVGAQPELFLGRGYTGHEHLNWFGLINMNARLYDPVHGRFLAPDPYVQAPDFTQSFNRYGYAFNNPLVYSDTNGEFIHLVIGAVVGGLANWITHGAEFSWKGLGYFGVGAAAGALAAGIGTGISSMLPVSGTASGGFAAGFLGTSAATTATSSFVSGALIGGGAGFAGGFVAGLGNSMIDGKNFGQSLAQGGIYGAIGLGSGGLFGGIAGGIGAVRDGREFWNGARMTNEQNLADQHLPLIVQRGDYNCAPATGETVTGVSQDTYRTIIGGDANRDPVTIKQLNDAIQTETGRTAVPFTTKLPSDKVQAEQLAGMMKQGNNFYLGSTLPGQPVGHATALNRITLQTFQKISGKLYHKVIYQVMDPARGAYRFIGATSMKIVVRIYP